MKKIRFLFILPLIFVFFILSCTKEYPELPEIPSLKNELREVTPNFENPNQENRNELKYESNIFKKKHQKNLMLFYGLYFAIFNIC